jgi:glucose/arabinose dehydrogenase
MRLRVRAFLGLSLTIAGCAGDAPPTAPAGDDVPPVASLPRTCQTAPVAGSPPLTTTLVVRGLDRPVDLQAPPGETRRLFVAEQTGRIRIVRDGVLLARPFLDLSARVGHAFEQGLLGLAFHPRYAQTGLFFVNYTDGDNRTHLLSFAASADPDVADPGTERTVLAVDKLTVHHNGGALAFGADGMLYVGVGDGISGGDPFGNAQNLGLLLGKILRLDVDRALPYAVPRDNPFVGVAAARPEIWAYGLRNPWRFSFVRDTGDLVIGDAGEDRVEEIDVGSGARGGGENYGWNIMEGTLCFSPDTGCPAAGLTPPVLEYDHDEGCVVIGGITYDGCRMPALRGTYFYSDYCTSFVRSFRMENGQAVDRRDRTDALGGGLDNVTSFGVDGEGEIHILDEDGEIYKIVPEG